MDDLFYRFRSLDRLLGKDERHGELEKLEIFFSHPSQLNDPLEGYKDIYWAGDSIAWTNLINHYITCLLQHIFEHLTSLTSPAPFNPSILIRNHSDTLPNTVAEIIRAAQLRAYRHHQVTDYISAISDFRKIRLQELTFHLNVIHRIMVHSIFSELESLRLSPFKTSDIVERLADDLTTCGHTAAAIKASTKYKFAETLYEKALGFKLAAKIEHMQNKQQQRWFFLMVEFPEYFSIALEELIHPKWYTACFMADCTNSSVWGSYGSNHTGVCLIYQANSSDRNRPTINLEIPVGEDRDGLITGLVPLELHKVDYERSFAQIDFFNSLGSLPVPTLNKFWYTDGNGNKSACGAGVGSSQWRQSYWDGVIEANTTKLKDWEYEKEYRAILHPSAFDISNAAARKCRYDFKCLNGLIFGIKTPTQAKLKIISIIRSLCLKHERKEFNFYQARYNPSTNKISHHSIDIPIRPM